MSPKGADWKLEYDRVVSDAELVKASPISYVPDIGLCVIGPLSRHVHYYALFGPTKGD